LWGKSGGDAAEGQRAELKRRHATENWEEKLEDIDRGKKRREDLEMSL